MCIVANQQAEYDRKLIRRVLMLIGAVVMVIFLYILKDIYWRAPQWTAHTYQAKGVSHDTSFEKKSMSDKYCFDVWPAADCYITYQEPSKLYTGTMSVVTVVSWINLQ